MKKNYPSRLRRNLVDLDETVVKANKKRYYVFSPIDVERNELILIRVCSARNYLTAKSFVREVLNYCENKPKFIVDKAPWLKKLEIGVRARNLSGREVWLNLSSALLNNE